MIRSLSTVVKIVVTWIRFEKSLILLKTELNQRDRNAKNTKGTKERQARTFDAAGIDFEVGVSRFEDLFKHIVNGDLPDPVGPKASKDEYTNLDNPPVSGTSPKGPNPILGGSRPKSQNDFLEFVGVVGEIHVYRFLRQEFDNAISADSMGFRDKEKSVASCPRGDRQN